MGDFPQFYRFFFFLLLSFLRLLAVKLLFSSSDIVSGRNEVPAVLFRFRCSGLHDCIGNASTGVAVRNLHQIAGFAKEYR